MFYVPRREMGLPSPPSLAPAGYVLYPCFLAMTSETTPVCPVGSTAWTVILFHFPFPGSKMSIKRSSVVSKSACHARGQRFKPHLTPGFFIQNIHFKSKIEGM